VSPSRGAGLLALVALLAAGAAGAATLDPRPMTLRLTDVPAGFARTKAHYVSNVQAARNDRTGKSFAKLGRLNGYDADYKRSAVTGLVEIDSTASTYRTAAGAHGSLAISFRAASAAAGYTRVSLGRKPLGDEARMVETTVRRNGFDVRLDVVMWRRGRVFAAIIGGGIAGTVSAQQVAGLARLEDAHIQASLR
jgi:hypothetical protein